MCGHQQRAEGRVSTSIYDDCRNRYLVVKIQEKEQGEFFEFWILVFAWFQ